VAAGYTDLRVTWSQLTQAPKRLAETLAAALMFHGR